jgi:hypothetical protein
VSLKKMLVEEHAGSVLYRSEYNPYFHTDFKLFPVTKFLVTVLQHLPVAGTRMIPWAAACCAADSESPRLRGERAVPHAPPCPPGSRGMEERPPGAAYSAPRHSLSGHRGSVRVGQGSTLRLGKTARKDVRGGSHRRQLFASQTARAPCAAPAVVPRSGASPSSPIRRRSAESSATSSRPARPHRGWTRLPWVEPFPPSPSQGITPSLESVPRPVRSARAPFDPQFLLASSSRTVSLHSLPHFPCSK